MSFKSIVVLTLWAPLPVLFCGCEPPVAPAVKGPPVPPPAVPLIAEESTELAPAKDEVRSSEKFGVLDRSQIPSAPRAVSEQPPIHLSAGVAVPQLLPDGTQIGVSVDYKINGSLKSSRYVMVLKSRTGTLSVPVNLSPMGGTLQGFFPPTVRPEDQPFQVWIDELPATGNRVPASNTEPLRTSY